MRYAAAYVNLYTDLYIRFYYKIINFILYISTKIITIKVYSDHKRAPVQWLSFCCPQHSIGTTYIYAVAFKNTDFNEDEKEMRYESCDVIKKIN